MWQGHNFWLESWGLGAYATAVRETFLYFHEFSIVIPKGANWNPNLFNCPLHFVLLGEGKSNLVLSCFPLAIFSLAYFPLLCLHRKSCTMKSIHLNYRGDVGPQFLGGPNTKNFQKGDQMLNNFRKSGKIAKIFRKIYRFCSDRGAMAPSAPRPRRPWHQGNPIPILWIAVVDRLI